jgi:hypothetical protein
MHPLEQRFDRAVEAALAVPGTRAPRSAPRLPPLLRDTLAQYEAGEAACAFYCERMPQMLIDQQLRGDDPARALLWRPLEPKRLPRLTAGLDRLCELQPAARGLIEGKRTLAALAAGTLLGTGLPLVGAWPGELARMNQELQERDADAVLDQRLSGGVVHELCHGLPRELREPAVPWMVLEACALWLGSEACPVHVFPEEAGDAVPGVSLFVLFGQCLARLFGERAVAGLAFGQLTLDEALGGEAARALRQLALRDFRARQEVPFARDALSALIWVRLVSGEWREQPATPLDLQIARTAVRALFQVNLLAEAFETHPLAAIHGLVLDVEQGRLERGRVAAGVFGEPGFWIWPPPLCRDLARRGVRRVLLEGALREQMGRVAEALIELSLGNGPLPPEVRWTSLPE